VRRLACRVYSLALIACISAAARAQQEITTLHVQAHLVEVAVTVTDGEGHFLDGLTRDNFHVLENGQPQKITSFENSAHALHCAILLDTTASMDSALPHVKNSVSRLIDELGPDDSVAIYTFADRLVIQQDWTTDKNAAKRAALRLRASGSTAFYDALAETSQEVAERPGKKAIVVFTDGDDNASVLNSVAASNRAKKDGIPLFTIAEGEATRSPKLKQILYDLGVSSGGSAYEAKSLSSIEEIFQKISDELRHMYLLTYEPHGDSSDGKWRSIAVSVDGRKELHARAREGYLPK